jgi:DNA-binding CsgD family transcriptional regulator/sugar-specific transcriptional regulator TrmB
MLLSAVGVDAEAEAVYRALLAEPECSVETLVLRVGLTPAEVASCLGRLDRLGLAGRSDRDPGCWRPVAPTTGLPPLLERAQLEVDRSRRLLHEAQTAASKLMADYPGLDVRASSGQFRPLHGVHEVQACLEELARTARRECLTMLPGVATARDRRLDQEMFDRGVTGRILWQDASRSAPLTMDYGRWLNRSGARVRTAPVLPTRMVVMDREVALIPLSDPLNPLEGAALVTAPGMILSLVALFEQTWETATPIEELPAVDSSTGLTDAERDLLILLSSGLTDMAVGKKLGVSERTVSRMVASVMTRLGASSRFEAGLEAARRGWL